MPESHFADPKTPVCLFLSLFYNLKLALSMNIILLLKN